MPKRTAAQSGEPNRHHDCIQINHKHEDLRKSEAKEIWHRTECVPSAMKSWSPWLMRGQQKVVLINILCGWGGALHRSTAFSFITSHFLITNSLRCALRYLEAWKSSVRTSSWFPPARGVQFIMPHRGATHPNIDIHIVRGLQNKEFHPTSGEIPTFSHRQQNAIDFYEHWNTPAMSAPLVAQMQYVAPPNPFDWTDGR